MRCIRGLALECMGPAFEDSCDIAGVFIALLFANLNQEAYHSLIHTQFDVGMGGMTLFGLPSLPQPEISNCISFRIAGSRTKSIGI